MKKYKKAMVCASDAGVIYAHIQAATHFMFLKDCEEAERRLYMLYDSGEELTPGDACGILSCINDFLMQGNGITDGMQKIIDGLKEKGLNIEQCKNGTYALAKRK